MLQTLQYCTADSVLGSDQILAYCYFAEPCPFCFVGLLFSLIDYWFMLIFH